MSGSTENTTLIIKEVINVKFSLYFKAKAFHIYLFIFQPPVLYLQTSTASWAYDRVILYSRL